MQECIKRNVSTETKLKFHVFRDERFVDLNLYQYGWEQTEPLPFIEEPSVLQGVVHPLGQGIVNRVSRLGHADSDAL